MGLETQRQCRCFSSSKYSPHFSVFLSKIELFSSFMSKRRENDFSSVCREEDFLQKRPREFAELIGSANSRNWAISQIRRINEFHKFVRSRSNFVLKLFRGSSVEFHFWKVRTWGINYCQVRTLENPLNLWLVKWSKVIILLVVAVLKYSWKPSLSQTLARGVNPWCWWKIRNSISPFTINRNQRKEI